MKIFLHENLSYESFFTQKFPDLQGWVINRLPQNPFHTDAPLKTEQNATKQLFQKLFCTLLLVAWMKGSVPIRDTCKYP